MQSYHETKDVFILPQIEMVIFPHITLHDKVGNSVCKPKVMWLVLSASLLEVPSNTFEEMVSVSMLLLGIIPRTLRLLKAHISFKVMN